MTMQFNSINQSIYWGGFTLPGKKRKIKGEIPTAQNKNLELLRVKLLFMLNRSGLNM